MFVTFEKTSSLVENKLLHKWIFLWNKIVKITNILIFKFFDIIYMCVKLMVRKWCDILLIHRKQKCEKIFVQTKI